MRDILEALQAHLGSMNPRLPTWIGEVPEGTRMPYASLSAASNAPDNEKPASGRSSRISGDVRLMVSDSTETNVHHRLELLHDHLSPGTLPTPLETPGRYTTIQWIRGEFVARDPDFVFPHTGRSAAWGVDTYRIDSQPLT